MAKTLREIRCEKDVEKYVVKRRCEKDAFFKTLLERRCGKDFVRKSF